MNNNEQSLNQNGDDFQRVARAVRFALVAVVSGFSYFCIHCSLKISVFADIFNGMGISLPPVTAFVLQARSVFVVLSFLWPVIAIAALFFRNLVSSFYLVGFVALLTIIHLVILYHALSEPFFHLSSAVGSR